MKKIVLKLYEFDELSKDSQERIIEREHWNVMEQCMDAYGISPVDWSLSKRLSRNTRRLEQACLIGMFGEYLEV